MPRIPFLLRRPLHLLLAALPARLLDPEILMQKKLMLLALALMALAAASAAPASAGPRGCGYVCSAPNCCNFCCIDTPCAFPICD